MYSTIVSGWARAVVLAVLLTGCELDQNACSSYTHNWLKERNETIEEYAAFGITDNKGLERARSAAAGAALAMIRYCLQECGTCEMVTVNLPPRLVSELRAASSQLAMTRVEVAAERDDRKAIVAFIDWPKSTATVAIGIDLRPGELTHLRIGELVP